MSVNITINALPVNRDPPGTRAVEVHMTDGGSVWMLVDAADFGGVKGALTSSRFLCGRLIGSAAQGFDGRHMMIPTERIQMLMDLDG